MAIIRCGWILVGLAWVAPATAHAQDTQDDAWTLRLTPYVWGSSTEGTFAHARLPVTLRTSKSFRDSLEELDAGAMGAFEARRGRHGLLLE